MQHFTNQREEFEGTRESILVWLTEMDLQLTNVEHFSESDADDKMRQLNVRTASLASLSAPGGVGIREVKTLLGMPASRGRIPRCKAHQLPANTRSWQ